MSDYKDPLNSWRDEEPEDNYNPFTSGPKSNDPLDNWNPEPHTDYVPPYDFNRSTRPADDPFEDIVPLGQTFDYVDKELEIILPIETQPSMARYSAIKNMVLAAVNETKSNIFTAYINERYEKLTSDTVSPHEKAILFEEVLTVLSMIHEEIKERRSRETGTSSKTPYLNEKYYTVSNKDKTMGGDLMVVIADLWANREKYHIPEMVHDVALRGGSPSDCATDGRKTTSFDEIRKGRLPMGGILNPNRTVDSCPVESAAYILSELGIGTSFTPKRGELSRTEYFEARELHTDRDKAQEKWEQQKEQLAQAEKEFKANGGYNKNSTTEDFNM